MSFTTEIKDELSRIPVQKECCALAECLGMLLYANCFSPERVRIHSDSGNTRKRAHLIFKLAFQIELAEDCAHKNALVLEDRQAIARIFAAFGYAPRNIALHLNRALVEEECCKSAFVRGAFLAGGYMSTPDKGYHLELVTSHYNVSRQVMALLMDMDMQPGAVTRRGNYVLYYKDSNTIEDFLAACGATAAAMSLMLKKVEKDLRNQVNRKVNCETANLSKTIDASARQIDAIRAIERGGQFDQLPAALQETARLRLANPELSLTELLPLFHPPLSKPGLNNRMRKLMQIAGEIEKK